MEKINADTYEDILWENRNLRWSARLLGSLEAGVLLYLTYEQVIKGILTQGFSTFIPSIGGQYFLAVSLVVNFIGLIIAYWKEGLGGGISLASLIVLFIGWSDFHVNFILGMGLISLPALLYITYRLRVKQAIKKTEMEQTHPSK